MKITFVIANLFAFRQEMIHAGIPSRMERRTIRIRLTPEQIKMIGLRQVGLDAGKPQYEEIVDIFIETEF